MTLHFSFACKLCGNKNENEFYVMPVDVKTLTGDVVHSSTQYRLTCKLCGQDHILILRITA